MTRYADVELLVTSWLANASSTRCVTELPAQITVPIIRVTRIGGPDVAPNLELAVVDIDCFAPPKNGNPDRAGAAGLASKVRGLLRYQLVGRALNGASVARVDTVSGPSWRPWDNTDLRRMGAIYQLTIHT